MRVAVYTDYTYRRVESQIYAERAFALFLARLSEELDQLIIVGKLDPDSGPARYLLPARVEFIELPYYASLGHPGEATVAMAGSLRAFWGVLGCVDGVWLLGPHPLALAFAGLAIARRKSVVLGIRSDFPRYVRARNPGRRWMHYVADALELIWRALARFTSVVAVGPTIAAAYPPHRTLEISVSLVRERDIVPASVAAERSYERGALRVLSVGRLEEEKNPLLLAQVIALLRAADPRWRLIVCGEGPLEAALRERCRELGVGGDVELVGYVPHDEGLQELYRTSHVLLHISLTEGVPQVLYEAFAARLPVVATAVGGVAGAVDDAALLIEPADAKAAASSVEHVCSDPELRAELIEKGLARLADRTLDAEARRVAEFLNGGAHHARRPPTTAQRVEAAYARYGQSGRKSRAWAASNPGNLAIRAEVFHALEEIAGDQIDGGGPILDVGCGTGGRLENLAMRVDPARLYGVDLVADRLESARNRVPDAHLERADARALPFASGKFALVLVFLLLLDLKDVEDSHAVLAECERVLAPGGVLVIYEPRFPNPLNRSTRAIRARDVNLPTRSRTLTLLPPLARRLGSRTPGLYPPLARFAPLRSHRLWWYRKPAIPDGPPDPVRASAG